MSFSKEIELRPELSGPLSPRWPGDGSHDSADNPSCSRSGVFVRARSDYDGTSEEGPLRGGLLLLLAAAEWMPRAICRARYSAISTCITARSATPGTSSGPPSMSWLRTNSALSRADCIAEIARLLRPIAAPSKSSFTQVATPENSETTRSPRHGRSRGPWPLLGRRDRYRGSCGQRTGSSLPPMEPRRAMTQNEIVRPRTLLAFISSGLEESDPPDIVTMTLPLVPRQGAAVAALRVGRTR